MIRLSRSLGGGTNYETNRYRKHKLSTNVWYHARPPHPSWGGRRNGPTARTPNYSFTEINPKSPGATKSIPLPPYSPDLVPCNFGLFPYTKIKSKGCGAVLRRSKRFKRNRRQRCRLSRTLGSEKFSSSGNRDGTGALQPRGTVSRVMVMARGLLPG